MRLWKSILQCGRWRAQYSYYDDGTPASLMISEVFEPGNEGSKYVTEFEGIQDLIDVLDLLHWQVDTNRVIAITQFDEQEPYHQDDELPF